MNRHWPARQIIPLDWSPQQALAVYEMLELLGEMLFELYGADIQAWMRDNQCSEFDPGPPSDPPF